MNICGCLVHVAPDLSDRARSEMDQFEGVEIHAESEDSRFVVVVEDTQTKLASETIMALHQIPGVLSLTLTFHHFEDADAPSSTVLSHAQQPAGGLSHDRI